MNISDFIAVSSKVDKVLKELVQLTYVHTQTTGLGILIEDPKKLQKEYFEFLDAIDANLPEGVESSDAVYLKRAFQIVYDLTFDIPRVSEKIKKGHIE